MNDRWAEAVLLQRLTNALADTITARASAEAVLGTVMDAFGAAAATLGRVDASGEALIWLAQVGYSEESNTTFPRLPLSANSVSAECASTGQPVFAERLEDLEERFRTTAGVARRQGFVSAAAVPLLIGERCLGTLMIHFREEQVFTELRRSLLMTVGGHLALAVERAELAERESAARQRAEALAARLRVLADASREFAESRLDLDAVLRSVAERLIADLAESCSLMLLGEDGLLRTVLVRARDPVVQEVIEKVGRLRPIRVGEGVNGRVVATMKGMLLPTVDPLESPAVAWTKQTPEFQEFFEKAYPATSLVTPLRVRGRAIGALSLARYRDSSPYTEEDLALAEELADRAALAIDSARAFEVEREAVRARDEFLSIASHELRTPLTSVVLKQEILARELRDERLDPARLSGHLEVMRRQVRRLSGLVSDLLDVSRMNSGQLSLQVDTVDLAMLLREVVTRHEPEAHSHGACLTVDAPERLEGRWDERRLEQVITNLIANAIKYGVGRPVHVVLVEADGRVSLRVEDQGIGIDPSELPRLFQPFERASSARPYGGVGLGLYITRRLVQLHGGTIEVRSKPGEGSRFEVSLPRLSPISPGDVKLEGQVSGPGRARVGGNGRGAACGSLPR